MIFMSKQHKRPRRRTKDLFIIVKITYGKTERTIRSTNPEYVAREMKKL